MPERQFGPYRLAHQIATGGMAEIYLAKTRGFGGFEKYVALKMIHPNFSSDEHFIEMLVDEAKLSVQLQHVNIAQIFDLGRVGNTYYITMEYVDGCDLYRLLRSASEKDLPMPIEIAVHVAKEVCAGLDYAHAKRDDAGHPLCIVHRDISPQNVLVSNSAEVKIVDFGIAKATMRARQTAVGVIKGKYYYMSPEQAWGDPVDHRTDIFSAGILLYEMLVGQMLYLEEDLRRLLDMVRKANIMPPSIRRPEVPPELERIVMKALAKSPLARWQSAHDFGTELERFLRSYAPDFTQSRLSSFLTRVFVDSEPTPEIAEDPSSPPVEARVTRGLGREAIMSRAEFADENSVIFQLADVRDSTSSGHTREAPDNIITAPRGAAAVPVPRVRGAVTTPLPARLANASTAELAPGRADEEHTVISAPPKFIAVDNDTTLPPAVPPRGVAVQPERTNEPGPRQVEYDEGDDSITPPIVPGLAHALFLETETSIRTTAFLEARTTIRPAPVEDPGVGAEVPLPAAFARNGWTPDPGDPGPAAPALVARLRPSLIAPPVQTSPTPIELRPVAWPDDVRTPVPRLTPSPSRTVLVATGVAAVVVAVGLIVHQAVLTPENQFPTSLELISIPPGAAVTIDGRSAGKAPLVVEGLEPQKPYRLRAELPRYLPWDRDDVKASKGKKLQVIAALRPVLGKLRVESTPTGAEVFIQNQSLGRTPLSREDLDPSPGITVEARLRGYKPSRQRLVWSDRYDAALRFVLEPTPD